MENFVALWGVSIPHKGEYAEEINVCFTVRNSTRCYRGLVASPSRSCNGWSRLQLNIAGDNTYTLITGTSPYFSTEILQSHDCTGPAGYEMEKPAGLATCQCTRKALHPSRPCTTCAWKLLQLSLTERALQAGSTFASSAAPLSSGRPHGLFFTLLPVSCCFPNFGLYLRVRPLQRPGAWNKPWIPFLSGRVKATVDTTFHLECLLELGLSPACLLNPKY